MKANLNAAPQDYVVAVNIIDVYNLKFANDCSIQSSVLLFDQRKESQSVSYTQSPTAINTSLTFSLKYINLQKYVKYNNPLHIVLIKIDNGTEEKTVIGSRKVEWRHILYGKQMNYNVEFFGPNFKQEGSLGSIRMSISFTTSLKKTQLVHQHEVTHQLTQELKLDNKGRKMFDEYTLKWWDDIKSIPKFHRKDLIKIYVDFDDRESL